MSDIPWAFLSLTTWRKVHHQWTVWDFVLLFMTFFNSVLFVMVCVSKCWWLTLLVLLRLSKYLYFGGRLSLLYPANRQLYEFTSLLGWAIIWMSPICWCGSLDRGRSSSAGLLACRDSTVKYTENNLLKYDIFSLLRCYQVVEMRCRKWFLI